MSLIYLLKFSLLSLSSLNTLIFTYFIFLSCLMLVRVDITNKIKILILLNTLIIVDD